MKNNKIRVLIVDDTALYRKIIRDVLEVFPEVEIVGTAPNGKIALSKIDLLKPDMMTLDVEMPEMNGIETLQALKKSSLNVAVIMISSLTQRDADVTMKALELGAFDFIAKPAGGDFDKNIESLKSQFRPKLKAFMVKQNRSSVKISTIPKPAPAIKKQEQDTVPMQRGFKTGKPKIIALGISTGGPRALAEVIPLLPANLPVPVVIVQHMPPVFTKALADSLDKKSQVTVEEGQDGKVLQAGHIYIAPGGKQMRITSGSSIGKYVIKITDDPPENHCKPSADYLFRSVDEQFKGQALGVIMTGMGRDGTKGLQIMRQNGARVIAQDEKSCVVYGMPMEAVKAGVVDEELSLSGIAAKIITIVQGY